MDIRLLSAIADILDTDVASLLEDQLHVSPSKETTAERSEPGKAPVNPPDTGNAALLQEIMALKADIRELIEFQKRAMKLLKL
jgi:hypothetical protein